MLPRLRNVRAGARSGCELLGRDGRTRDGRHAARADALRARKRARPRGATAGTCPNGTREGLRAFLTPVLTHVCVRTGIELVVTVTGFLQLFPVLEKVSVLIAIDVRAVRAYTSACGWFSAVLNLAKRYVLVLWYVCPCLGANPLRNGYAYHALNGLLSAWTKGMCTKTEQLQVKGVKRESARGVAPVSKSAIAHTFTCEWRANVQSRESRT